MYISEALYFMEAIKKRKALNHKEKIADYIMQLNVVQGEAEKVYELLKKEFCMYEPELKENTVKNLKDFKHRVQTNRLKSAYCAREG